MTFAELLDVLRGFEGRMAEVTVSVPAFDGERLGLSSFSGTVREVRQGGGSLATDLDRPWRVWFEENPGPSTPCASFHPRLFIDATFEADREEADYAEGEFDPDDRTGLTWTLTVLQAGVMTEILVYV
jgi:hypothetical protein